MPADVRVDTWVRDGHRGHAVLRPAARQGRRARRRRAPTRSTRLRDALGAHRASRGIETNLDLLRVVRRRARVPPTARSRHATLERHRRPAPRRSRCSRPASSTTVQDLPGRLGLLARRRAAERPDGRPVVPARQPHRSATPRARPGLECTAARPDAALRRRHRGLPHRRRDATPTLDGDAACRGGRRSPVAGRRDARARRRVAGPGCARTCSSRGGLDVPDVPRQRVDVHARRLRRPRRPRAARRRRAARSAPEPRAPPTPRSAPVPDAGARRSTHDVGARRARRPARRARLLHRRRHRRASTRPTWQVHYHSSRTGVRLVGPAPEWARADGGEAGLHPSNIHDTPYAVGAVDFTGDMPIILGPDGPSLGGFVVPGHGGRRRALEARPARAGRPVRFVPVDRDEAARPDVAGRGASSHGAPPRAEPRRRAAPAPTVLAARAAATTRPQVTLPRAAATRTLLVEYGPMVLDLDLRLRVHALRGVGRRRATSPGVVELTPGIRSLQVHFDPADAHASTRCSTLLPRAEDELPAARRRRGRRAAIVHLPLSWDDPATREAIERVHARRCATTRRGARGTSSSSAASTASTIVDDVRRHRVRRRATSCSGSATSTSARRSRRRSTRATASSPPSTTRPARGRPENAVGIGGAYLCIYGMEGPGGYQFVGRTVPVWNTLRRDRGTRPREQPWLLRFFDQIRWYPGRAPTSCSSCAPTPPRGASTSHRRRRPSRVPSTARSSPSTPRRSRRSAPRREARSPTSARAGRRGEFARGELDGRRSRRRRTTATSTAARRCVRRRGAAARRASARARRARASASRPATRGRQLEAMKTEIVGRRARSGGVVQRRVRRGRVGRGRRTAGRGGRR